MSLQFSLLYVSTIFIASIIPGPSMLLALTHGMQYGARRTVASAMGNVTVTLIQALISVAGLGTILIASEITFQVIKMLGSAYLIYLGISILLSSKTSLVPEINPEIKKKTSLRKMYLQAAMVTAGNPKAIVFFTAVFPQFIKHDSSYLPQFLSLMSIGSIIAFSCFMLYAICGQKIVRLFFKASFGKKINKLMGYTFIATGIGLAVENR